MKLMLLREINRRNETPVKLQTNVVSENIDGTKYHDCSIVSDSVGVKSLWMVLGESIDNPVAIRAVFHESENWIPVINNHK